MQTLIRCHILPYLIWFYTICLGLSAQILRLNTVSIIFFLVFQKKNKKIYCGNELMLMRCVTQNIKICQIHFLKKQNKINKYGKCPKNSNTKASDKMTCANSVNPDQTAPEGAV